jgi:hypothetical protein
VSVKISIVGGSYESGAPTVTLEQGKTLTLVNTADGVRYVLKLLKDCDNASSGDSAIPVQPPSPPPPPPAQQPSPQPPPATTQTTQTDTTSTDTTPTSTIG